jgi:hypothetical protein
LDPDFSPARSIGRASIRPDESLVLIRNNRGLRARCDNLVSPSHPDLCLKLDPLQKVGKFRDRLVNQIFDQRRALSGVLTQSGSKFARR